MDDKPARGHFTYIFVAALFFILGAISVFSYQSFFVRSTNQEKTEELLTVSTTPSPRALVVDKWTPIPSKKLSTNNSESTLNSSLTSKKFTIEEIEKISADKTEAQTGETVNFRVILQNTGAEKKFLTHICFQYNGGNFGCIRNKNLGPGEVFGFSNSMMFKTPGTESVYVVWSQDKENFYRAKNSGMAHVKIY